MRLLKPVVLPRAAMRSYTGNGATGTVQKSTGSNPSDTNDSSVWQTRRFSTSDLKRNRSPALDAHRPKTESPDEETKYVLTLLTDKAHHERMTDLREKYFPRHLNKVAAHITLFHALPKSKLASNVIPAIHDVATRTMQFDVLASRPFRFKRGIGISIPKNNGGQHVQELHSALQQAWIEEGFLSAQDESEFRAHYTIMNKVDDEDRSQQAYEEVTRILESSGGVVGTVEGLILWKYEKGWWKWERRFEFGNR